MWRDNFIRLLNESKLTPKQLGDKCGVSENTIKRIVKCADATIQLATLDRLVQGLGCKLHDITSDTNAIIGGAKLEELQKLVIEQGEKIVELENDKALLVADNNLLKTESDTLRARLELAETKLTYTEKILLVYEKYNK